MFQKICVGLLISIFAFSASATDSGNLMDELNPFDPNVENLLKQYDQEQEAQTGKPSHLGPVLWGPSCYQDSCEVWAHVVKSEQKLYLFIDGELQNTFDVSTGDEDHETPDFDTHPNGRVYDQYSSHTFPGGDYKGLGNMPYAVFISGGFAIHGTTPGNFARLGTQASHGCVRLHPDNAYIFNRLVREHGVENVWITVED